MTQEFKPSELFVKVASLCAPTMLPFDKALRDQDYAKRDAMFAHMHRLIDDDRNVFDDEWFFDPFDELIEPGPDGQGVGCDTPQDAMMVFELLWIQAVCTSKLDSTKRDALVSQFSEIAINGY